MVIQVQIQGEAVCISHNINTLQKCMTQPILWVNNRVDCFFLTLVWQPVEEKENSEFEAVVLCLKIDLVSHPRCGEGVE